MQPQTNLPQSQTLDPKQLAKDAEDRKLKKQFKETLWPFLEVSVKDLQEAIALVDLAQMGIESAMKAKKNKMTLKSLDIKLIDGAPEYKKIKFLYDTLQDETVGKATEILASLKNTVNDYANTKISKAPMSEIKDLFDKEFKDV
jgi:hypothetical protein